MAANDKSGFWDDWKTKHPRWHQLLILGLEGIAGLIVVGLIWLFKADGWSLWSQNRENVRDLVLIFAGIAGVPFVIWREYSTHRAAKAAERQADTAAERHEKQTKADTERRITDNFTKAIELLGSEKLHVRIGGINALERIAHESERDHWPIMETLTAYVRNNGKAKYHRVSQDDKDNDKAEIEKEPEYLSTEEVDKIETKPNIYATVNSDIPPEVEAILTVLGRRKSSYENSNQKISLICCNMWRVEWRSCSFIAANFSGANLFWARLSGADLSAIWLQEADLTEADLTGAILTGADLSMSVLAEANLSGANLSGANLSGAYLCEANLSGAILTGAILSGADLTETNLSGANLTGAILEDRDEAWGRAEGANLSDAKFCRTIMPDGTVNNRDWGSKPKPSKFLEALNFNELRLYHPARSLAPDRHAQLGHIADVEGYFAKVLRRSTFRC